jgi:solute carrier family 39 (zinc transporter), member 1/2/3
LFAHINLKIDAHGHGVGSVAAHGPEGDDQRGLEQTNGNRSYEKKNIDDVESLQVARNMDDNAAAQIIGVMILEFGVVLHRYNSTANFL